MPTKQRFDEKDPIEKLPLTFDFTQGLAALETLTGTPIVTVRVDYSNHTGGDPTPTNIFNGPASFDATNKVVFVPVKDGLDGVDYDIVVEVLTSNVEKVLVMGAILPVRTQ